MAGIGTHPASHMRLELIPIILGIAVGLIGLGLMVDAWTPDDIIVKKERRRRPRLERNRGGEAAIGIGILCMGAAFVGRDTWRYSVIAVIAGSVVLLYGVIRNWHYLGGAISNRGALRRRPEVVIGGQPEGAPRSAAGKASPPRDR